MTLAEAFQRATALPQEKQQELSEFIEFLLSRSKTKRVQTESTELELDTPFFGMWADRPEMADSAAYVQALRQREWEGRHAAD
ncbi:MAG: hypothetical protein COZ20_05380 [Gallionellales bacterium CG_4_10_14_3_um_filter_54_96]|nr:MAG: hypothetical protein COS43_05920 [Gallionellales bacterium CG03_land_8_20_14_0_80_55_15]PIY04539.1 MAG: hypothetical protein COZ20_05380 [Gallionellales bacterium CG_4_10_14_3_um_filter_54_96]HCJ51488.1 hypothetical protein [Gallionella sp.]